MRGILADTFKSRVVVGWPRKLNETWGEVECHVIGMRSEARAEQVVGMGCEPWAAYWAVVRRKTRAACEAMRNASVLQPRPLQLCWAGRYYVDVESPQHLSLWQLIDCSLHARQQWHDNLHPWMRNASHEPRSRTSLRESTGRAHDGSSRAPVSSTHSLRGGVNIHPYRPCTRTCTEALGVSHSNIRPPGASPYENTGTLCAAASTPTPPTRLLNRF
jgi:hypothetical protein